MGKIIGEKLRYLRECGELTQQQLATCFKIDRSTYAQGDKSNPNRVLKRRIFDHSTLKYSPIRKVLAAFCALIDQKSALFKICDRKSRSVRGVLAQF